MTDTADGPASGPSPTVVAPVNVTALFAEAAGKSGLMWVQPPGDRAWPFWHAWVEDTVYVVSGPGEQTLPWLPEDVLIVVRSKDTGGRLLTVHATVRELAPDDEQWATATEVLRTGRLNATDDVVERWARECTVRAIRPYGAPVEAPGAFATTSGAAQPPASAATTTHWRPWHWRGRPRRRRGNRLPDEG